MKTATTPRPYREPRFEVDGKLTRPEMPPNIQVRGDCGSGADGLLFFAVAFFLWCLFGPGWSP